MHGVRLARALTPLLVAAAVFFLFAVLVPGVGVTVNGAQRWIGAGLLQFQPSELAKVAIVLYAAHLLAGPAEAGPNPLRAGAVCSWSRASAWC